MTSFQQTPEGGGDPSDALNVLHGMPDMVDPATELAEHQARQEAATKMSEEAGGGVFYNPNMDPLSPDAQSLLDQRDGTPGIVMPGPAGDDPDLVAILTQPTNANDSGLDLTDVGPLTPHDPMPVFDGGDVDPNAGYEPPVQYID